MTEPIAALPPAPLPNNRPDGPPGLEHDTVETGKFWSTDEGPTFAEFLDIINPLQHIPVVSTIYRAITGDEIGNGPRFIGGMLFGGPVGAIAAGVTALFEEASGADVGTHIARLVDEVTGDGDSPPVAENPDATKSAAQQAALPAAATPSAAAPATVQQAALSAAPAAAARPAVALRAFPAFPAQSAPPMPAGMANRIAFNRNAALGAAMGPAAAAAPVAARPAPAAPASAIGDSETQRIKAALYRTQRAEADRLLAGIIAERSREPGGAGADSTPSDDRPAATGNRRAPAAVPHPFLPPKNASPQWVARAMEEAMRKYQSGRPGATPAAASISLSR